MSDRVAEIHINIKGRVIVRYEGGKCVDVTDTRGKKLYSAQAQASKPIAVVTGWYDGRCVIEPLDRALAIPVGMALYSQPQAQAVNQQLLEALKKAERSLLSTMMAVTEPSPRRFKEQGWELVLDIKAAIAAAQEQSK